MKKKVLFGVLVTAISACLCLTGCDDEYKVPTKTGGGGKSQTYIPKGNKNGGQYVHLEKK